MQDPRGELTQIKLQRTKLRKGLERELIEVSALYRDLKDMTGVNDYLKRRKATLEDQIAWLYLFTKDEDDKTKKAL